MTRFWAWQTEGVAMPVLAISGPIDTDMWFGNEVTPRDFARALAAHEGEEILVSVDSPGGDVFAGFDIYSQLKLRRGVTNVRVMGIAASASSYICMAASPGRLTMCRASMMMIHKPRSSSVGTADDKRGEADVLDALEDMMVDIYRQRATIDEAALRAMLREERYLSPTEAMAIGLCDAIADPPETAEAERAARAAMGARYAAMDMAQVRALRRTLPIDPPRRTAEPEVPKGQTHDYLAMADAIIAAIR